uniref:Sulfotransferase n=1 Tax=Leersia perrieri TaxID=77586 RepID=A0A0D9XSC1_9ORYZ
MEGKSSPLSPLRYPLKFPMNGILKPAQRLLSTHLPIVYICRDPKDVLVSAWLFTNKIMHAFGHETGGNIELCLQVNYTIDQAFELFCDGRCIFGPHWNHVLVYWEESRRRPEERTPEEMLYEPTCHVRKMAEFLGCPFTEDEEEAARVGDDIIHLCSFDHLRSLAVNKTGAARLGIPIGNDTFFRKAVAGWSNHMTLEMAVRLDIVVKDALRGSEFEFTFGVVGEGQGTRL